MSQAIEPILQENKDRFVIFPIQHHDIWEWYKKQEASIWTAEEIIDIDMSRWIATTGNARETWKAKAVTNDGQTIVLDDYIFENMHLIIGSLAHKFYPKQWTPIAKRVKVEELESVDQQVEEE